MKKIFFTLVILFPAIANAEEYPTLISLPQDPYEAGLDHGVRWEAYVLEKGDTLSNLFKNLDEDAIRFNRLGSEFWKEGVVIRMPEDINQIKNWTPMPENYKRCAKIRDCVVISLRDQFLGLYKGRGLKRSFPVSTGMNKIECGKTEKLKNCRTPIGNFSMRRKILNAFSIPYKVWMRYAVNIGYGRYIHTGVLPGYAASHGCIRMLKKDAKVIFNLASPRMKIFIVREI